MIKSYTEKMIILDSSFIISYRIENDENHERAVKIMIDIAEGNYGIPLISDYVFDEIITVIFNKAGFSSAVDLGDVLITAPNIYYIDKELFENSWEIFKNQKTKLSFTDCSILAIMEKESIKNIATFDKDFLKIKDIKVVG